MNFIFKSSYFAQPQLMDMLNAGLYSYLTIIKAKGWVPFWGRDQFYATIVLKFFF